MNLKTVTLSLLATALLIPAAASAAEPLSASFERAFSESAGLQPGVHPGDTADALTAAFNQALWTKPAPARQASPDSLLASFDRAFSETAGVRGVAAGVHAGDAADALTVAFNEALWTKPAPARYATSPATQQTKRN